MIRPLLAWASSYRARRATRRLVAAQERIRRAQLHHLAVKLKREFEQQRRGQR
jgi:hypothetical protein